MKAKFKYDQPPLLAAAATLGVLLTLAAAAAAAAASFEAQPGSSNYGASFISNPAIYAYTVANQQKQQAARADSDNYINFDTGNVNGNANVNEIGNANANANDDYRANRNFYYTDGDAAPTLTTPQAPAPAPAAATQPAPLTGCTLDRLAVYKVVLHTYWTRELFPKHYPDWRPTAQWTKTLGKCRAANGKNQRLFTIAWSEKTARYRKIGPCLNLIQVKNMN